jgi:hypothetical protein
MIDFRHRPETSDKKLRVAVEKPDLTRSNAYSHNWCDQTTWYGSSVRIVDEVAQNAGDNQTYYLDNYNVIDTYHGKLFDEDYLTDDDGYNFLVSITVDGYSKTEQDPHYASGGDFTVDYELAEINFLSPLSPSSEVLVTYHYATDSVFYARIDSGKKLFIVAAEVQFSDDMELNDSFKYQVYVTNPYNPGGPKVPYGNPNIYKKMSDFQIEATKAYTSYPPLGGSGWRAMPRAIYILNWDYLSGTVLASSTGAEIRVWMEHDAPCSGTYATITFYGVTEDE